MPTICMQCGDPSSVLVQGFCSVHCFDCAFQGAIRGANESKLPIGDLEADRVNGPSERIDALERMVVADHERIVKLEEHNASVKETYEQAVEFVARKKAMATGISDPNILEFFRSKPPLDLKPRSFHDEQRVEEIVEAMGRYSESNKPIPAEWTSELSDISKEQSR